MESINENVHHIQELIQLNKTLLKQLSHILYKLKDDLNKDKIKRIPLLTLNYVPIEYSLLNPFIDDSGLKVGFEYSNEVGGEFLVHDNIIYLYLNDEILNNLNEIINEPDFDKSDIDSYINKEFKVTLLHELQHAFDKFRSNNKMFTDKEHQDYFKSLKNKNDIKDWVEKNKKWQQYINLTSEVWARVTETLSQISFYKLNKDNTTELKDVKDILKLFSQKFKYWNELEPEKKKRVIKFIMNYYYTL